MDRDEILTRLQAIISEVVDNEEVVITHKTIANDVDGWDSLAHIMIIGEIRNEFAIKLTSAEIANIDNVGSMIEVIYRKLN